MDFPTFFQSMYPGMIMIEKDPKYFELWPQCQLDWVYILSKESSTVWKVCGIRDTGLLTSQTVEKTYHLVNDMWITQD